MTPEQEREITDTLKTINTNYGRGEITQVQFNDIAENGDCSGCAVAKKQYGHDYPRFTVVGQTITFRGVSRKIGYKVR